MHQHTKNYTQHSCLPAKYWSPVLVRQHLIVSTSYTILDVHKEMEHYYCLHLLCWSTVLAGRQHCALVLRRVLVEHVRIRCSASIVVVVSAQRNGTQHFLLTCKVLKFCCCTDTSRQYPALLASIGQNLYCTIDANK